ncbi:hypothetical protein IFM89_021913 [Coptis chinensis]|uniref:C2 domain-containing protein n=1 Tax=Coptis chinensis TaxID=261450 RepID=A0A835HGP8_9MAGN|nr:hypothetical protein IFM89_021913 [Coptis chinensis]
MSTFSPHGGVGFISPARMEGVGRSALAMEMKVGVNTSGPNALHRFLFTTDFGLSVMEHLLGLLKIRVCRGINLAVRDVRSSDPYVVIKIGKQKVKTSVMYNNVNPEWNEDLTLSISDASLPVKLTVYDKDTFSMDDKMGDAEFDIKPFLEAVKMHLVDLPSGTIVTKVTPSRQNCLSEESSIIWVNGSILQNICLRLRNVECGEVELQLMWVDVPGSRGV